ncbi:hypothetical protein PZA11_002365 [Diplocarpon coronariae]
MVDLISYHPINTIIIIMLECNPEDLPEAFRVLCVRCARVMSRKEAGKNNTGHVCAFNTLTSKKCDYCIAQQAKCIPIPIQARDKYIILRDARVGGDVKAIQEAARILSEETQTQISMVPKTRDALQLAQLNEARALRRSVDLASTRQADLLRAVRGGNAALGRLETQGAEVLGALQRMEGLSSSAGGRSRAPSNNVRRQKGKGRQVPSGGSPEGGDLDLGDLDEPNPEEIAAALARVRAQEERANLAAASGGEASGPQGFRDLRPRNPSA